MGNGTFILNLLLWLIKVLRHRVSCCRTYTGPSATILHDMHSPHQHLPCTQRHSRTLCLLALLQIQDKWLVCSKTALSPADAMLLRGHCSNCSGKTDWNLQGREDAVETCLAGITMSHPLPQPVLSAEALACSRHCTCKRDSLARTHHFPSFSPK